VCGMRGVGGGGMSRAGAERVVSGIWGRWWWSMVVWEAECCCPLVVVVVTPLLLLLCQGHAFGAG
jgi:hypothetical protein